MTVGKIAFELIYDIDMCRRCCSLKDAANLNKFDVRRAHCSQWLRTLTNAFFLRTGGLYHPSCNPTWRWSLHGIAR